MSNGVVYRGIELESYCLPNSNSVGDEADKLYCDAVGCFETPTTLSDGYVLCAEHADALESTEDYVVQEADSRVTDALDTYYPVDVEDGDVLNAMKSEEWGELFEFVYVNADGDMITHSIDRNGATLEEVRVAFDTFLIAIGYSIEDSTSEVA